MLVESGMFLSWQPRSDEYLIGILFDIVICCDKKKKEFYWGRSTNNFAVCSFQFRMLSMVQRLEAEAMFFYLHSHQLAPGRSLGLCDNPSFLSTVWFSCRRSLPLTLSSSSPSGLVPGKAAAGGEYSWTLASGSHSGLGKAGVQEGDRHRNSAMDVCSS